MKTSSLIVNREPLLDPVVGWPRLSAHPLAVCGSENADDDGDDGEVGDEGKIERREKDRLDPPLFTQFVKIRSPIEEPIH